MRKWILASLACLALGAAPSTNDDWPSYGRDATNQRYSPLATINTDNASTLKLAWRHDAKPERMPPVDGIFKQESTPIVVGGVIYYTYPGPQVFALDATSGRELWRYSAISSSSAMKLCCGPNNRGVAVADGRVFVATLDARVIALDAKSDAVIWQSRAAPSEKGYSFTMAPLVVDDEVIVGVAGGEFEIRGFVDAYDVKTGARIWRFYTVPSPEEGGWWGSWSKTTPDGDALPRDIAREKADSARYADAWQRGGAPIWTTPPTTQPSASSTSALGIRARTTTITSGRATICTRTRSSRSMRRRGSIAGTIRRCRTISGTMIWPARRC